MDCSEKTMAVVYNEETVRARKKQIRTSSSYSCHSSLCFYSGHSLVPDLAPEKKRSVYQGYNAADVVGFVESGVSAESVANHKAVEREDLGSCRRRSGFLAPGIFVLASATVVPSQQFFLLVACFLLARGNISQ